MLSLIHSLIHPFEKFDSFKQISAAELSDSVNRFKTLIQLFRKSLHILHASKYFVNIQVLVI